ncbi:hypothetical protein ACFY5F_50140 [Streptomyces sp. NPDC013161]|uniref:hypothetical protein n=1 Tax=Streptomyces sp. NPDC013161 TaxID=3364862 RepID=UPI003691E90D
MRERLSAVQRDLQPGRTGRRSRVVVTAAAAIAGVAALGVSMFGGGPVERPDRPGTQLAAQLGALRGANDLVRATRAEVGRDPALYPTAYGRLEAALPGGHRTGAEPPVPGIRPAALARLARTDMLDTPAWRAQYVCLSLSAAGTSQASEASDVPRAPNVLGATSAAAVLERAGLLAQVEAEALGYLRTPDPEDDATTSLATRAAFLQTLACLGRDDQVAPATLTRLAADTAQVDQPVPALYAVEALRAVGVRARATRVLRHAGADLRRADCAGSEPIQRAASALLRRELTPQTRACLLPALHDPDTQTRWLVRRALALGASDPSAPPIPAPTAAVRSDGLVAKSPTQLGTLTATYNAARALTASGGRERAPDWLEKGLKRLGLDPGLDPSDRLLLAMTCHRLSLGCGPQAAEGARAAAAERAVPARLTTVNQHSWYGATAARAEFGLGCPRTSVESLAHGGDALPAPSLRVVVVLADAGCTAQARRLTEGTDLVAQAQKALRDGELVTASDAIQAALATDQNVMQTFWNDLPALLKPYRDAEFPDLYADSPGGAASADATRAAYYLLA